MDSKTFLMDEIEISDCKDKERLKLPRKKTQNLN